MQNQSLDHEQKQIDEIIITNSSLPVTPSILKDSLSVKPSPSSRYSTMLTRLNAYTEVMRRESISPIPPKNYDDVLSVRSLRQYNKSGYNDNEYTSIITINVSGVQFQTQLSTLELYPNTLLGNENKRKFYWNSQTKEYFFDRHRVCFEAILYYYQSNGRLRRPEFVPLDTFLEEIVFFELGEDALNQVRENENVKVIKQRPMPKNVCRWYIWYYFQYPQHSLIARVINIISMCFTILSSLALAIETLPRYANYWDNICKLQANVSLNSTYVPTCSAHFTSPFFIIETISVVYFTIEFLLRLISTPSYRRFILSFFNWVDLTTIVPYYVFLAIQLADKNVSEDTRAIISIRLLRILRFSRVFKIYLVFRRLKSLRVLSATMKESLIDFLVLIIMLTLLAFLFGAATYFAEQQTNGIMFDSIPKAIYWGIITITGVGYGDMYPITVGGRILTCFCALFGSATMGMLTSVLVDRYQRVFNRKMYVSEEEIPLPDCDTKSNHDDNDVKSNDSSSKSERRRKSSQPFIGRISSVQEKIKNDRYQALSKLRFVVSFKDDCVSDEIVTVMKRKLTEAILTTDIDVNLKLIDDNSQEIWAISSSNSLERSIPKIIFSSDVDDKEPKQESKIAIF